MSDDSSPAQDRAARLAAALRANLHKRKAQARAGREATTEKPDQPDQ